MNPRHYRDMIIRVVGQPNGETLDLIVSHVIHAERAKQILRTRGYGMTGLPASATAALVAAVSTGTRVMVQHFGCSSNAAGAPQFAAPDGALVLAVRGCQGQFCHSDTSSSIKVFREERLHKSRSRKCFECKCGRLRKSSCPLRRTKLPSCIDLAVSRDD